ncbi:MAG: hypothetical protein JWR19_526 [Pedosphaera sp.]|nr:hypothetical protein [Pedosphaera sp.]
MKTFLSPSSSSSSSIRPPSSELGVQSRMRDCSPIPHSALRIPHFLKIVLVLVVVLVVELPSPASTPVQFNTQDFLGQPLNTPITLSAVLKLQSSGGIIVAQGPPIILTPASGTVTTNLYAGIYNGTIQGVTKGFVLLVPDQTNTLIAANSCLSNLVTFSYTNLNAWISNYITLRGGTNITLRTNGFVVYVDSSAGGTGTVTSVDMAVPAEFTIAGGPVTAAGTLTLGKANQAANKIFAGPATGSAAAPAFRLLAAADIPDLSATYATPATITAATNTLGTAARSNATAFQGAGLSIMIANNGIDFANRILTASNISIIGVSNQLSLPTITPTAGIIGQYPGQLLVTYGQGAGGNNTHQLFTWTTNSGSANWDGGLEIPGAFKASSMANLPVGGGAAHVLIASNNNNVLEIVQNGNGGASAGYSAIGCVDVKGVEQLAFGYAGSNVAAAFYQDTIYWAVNVGKPFTITDAGGKQWWGAEGGTASKWASAGTGGDFVRWKTGTTNADPTNVVFRVDGAGGINANGLAKMDSLRVTNDAVFNGTNVSIPIGNKAIISAGQFKAADSSSATTPAVVLYNGGPNGFASPNGTQIQITEGGAVKVEWSGFDGSWEGNCVHTPLWSNTGAVNTAHKINVNNTVGTNLLSLILDLQTNGVSKFSVDVSGNIVVGTGGEVIGATSATASSILDVQSTTKAFMPPRMTKTQRNAIVTQAPGMVVYQTDNTAGLRVYNGTHWVKYTETNDD